MDHDQLHRRAREQGANRLLYWLGRAPVPGRVLPAANHRIFVDPLVIATMARRPMYYVAKNELFRYRGLAWILSALGAFPVERGSGDGETIQTAKAILARGGIVLIFVEGTRIRPGTLGKAQRGG